MCVFRGLVSVCVCLDVLCPVFCNNKSSVLVFVTERTDLVVVFGGSSVDTFGPPKQPLSFEGKR